MGSLRVELTHVPLQSTAAGGGGSAGSVAAAAAAAVAVAAAAVVGDPAETAASKGLKEGAGEANENKKAYELRTLVAFLVGLGEGPEGQAVSQLPGGVFVLVMTMLMPRWDPLRRGLKEK